MSLYCILLNKLFIIKYVTNFITQKYPNIQTNELNEVQIFSLENRKQGKDITESNYSTLIIKHKNSHNMILPMQK